MESLMFMMPALVSLSRHARRRKKRPKTCRKQAALDRDEDFVYDNHEPSGSPPQATRAQDGVENRLSQTITEDTNHGCGISILLVEVSRLSDTDVTSVGKD
jgi:hypothetical protein